MFAGQTTADTSRRLVARGCRGLTHLGDLPSAWTRGLWEGAWGFPHAAGAGSFLFRVSLRVCKCEVRCGPSSGAIPAGEPRMEPRPAPAPTPGTANGLTGRGRLRLSSFSFRKAACGLV